MKRLVIFTTLAITAAVARPGLADDTVDMDTHRSDWRQPSPLRSVDDDPGEDTVDGDSEARDSGPYRLRLYLDRARQTGRAERHSGFEDTLELYDDSGSRTGRVRQHPMFEDRFDVYDESGQRVQRIRKNPVFDDRYDI